MRSSRVIGRIFPTSSRIVVSATVLTSCVFMLSCGVADSRVDHAVSAHSAFQSGHLPFGLMCDRCMTSTPQICEKLPALRFGLAATATHPELVARRRESCTVIDDNGECAYGHEVLTYRAAALERYPDRSSLPSNEFSTYRITGDQAWTAGVILAPNRRYFLLGNEIRGERKRRVHFQLACEISSTSSISSLDG